MAKTCGSCGLAVNDAALVCEKCGYQFASDPKATVPAEPVLTGAIPNNGVPNPKTSRNIAVWALVAVVAVVIALCYYLKSFQKRIESVPRQSVSTEERTKVVGAMQAAFKRIKGDLHGIEVSERAEVLTFDSKAFSNSVSRAMFWDVLRESGFVSKEVTVTLEQLCALGFRQARIGYGTIGDNYSLGCLGKPPSEAVPYLPSDIVPLVLLSNRWHTESGYAIMEGQVLNVSEQPLENVEAVATFYDAKGEFVTSDNAVIDYNPILPAQKSSYKVIVTYNPAMRQGGVEFKYLGGGSIRFVQK